MALISYHDNLKFLSWGFWHLVVNSRWTSTFSRTCLHLSAKIYFLFVWQWTCSSDSFPSTMYTVLTLVTIDSGLFQNPLVTFFITHNLQKYFKWIPLFNRRHLSFSLTHMCRCTHSSHAMQDSNLTKHSSHISAREVLTVLSWQSKLLLSYHEEHNGTQCIIKNNSLIKSVIMSDSVSILTAVASIYIEICVPRISFIHHYIIQSKITKCHTAHDFTYCTFIHHWLYAALVFCTLSSQHVFHSYALL